MFIPQEGSYLTIDLPGEALRALVEKVVSFNSVIAKIISQPMAKSHNYKKDDIIACRRNKTFLGEKWEAVPDHRLMMEDLIKQEQAEEEKKNAIRAGEKSIGDKPQHKRDGKKRPSKKSSDSRKPVKCKKASKGK